MHFAMTNGGESRTCFPEEPAMSVLLPDNRRFVEAVPYRYRAGILWHGLPERLEDWKNTHRRISRWAKKGVWQSLFRR
jgi:hypothetical protein